MSKLIRQTHRWLSIVFTVTVIANFVLLGLNKQIASGHVLATAPARLAHVHRSVFVRAAVCRQAGCQGAPRIRRGAAEAQRVGHHLTLEDERGTKTNAGGLA